MKRTYVLNFAYQCIKSQGKVKAGIGALENVLCSLDNVGSRNAEVSLETAAETYIPYYIELAGMRWDDERTR